MTTLQSSLVRPFLKWPGGKFRLLSILGSHLGHEKILVEPFVGAGALFLNTQHQQIWLNDLNSDLINLFHLVQQQGPQLLGEAKKFFTPKHNQAKIYYQLRERFNHSQDTWERALLFLYLNRHGYNGLCRYNRKGGYNVPFGAHRQPYFPAGELQAFAQRAHAAKFYCQDYAAFLKRFLASRARLDNHLFYFDPPYAALSNTANFTTYAAGGFSQEAQQQLADLARALAAKGARVLVSNHDTGFTREIYHSASSIESLTVRRTISCKITAREKVPELIACFQPRSA